VTPHHKECRFSAHTCSIVMSKTIYDYLEAVGEKREDYDKLKAFSPEKELVKDKFVVWLQTQSASQGRRIVSIM
jgi:hypothetical protein